MRWQPTRSDATSAFMSPMMVTGARELARMICNTVSLGSPASKILIPGIIRPS